MVLDRVQPCHLNQDRSSLVDVQLLPDLLALVGGSGALSLYVSDRAVDNDNTPNENDGMVHELTYPGSGGLANTRPTVSAGPDRAVTQPNAATLNASAAAVTRGFI